MFARRRPLLLLVGLLLLCASFLTTIAAETRAPKWWFAWNLRRQSARLRRSTVFTCHARWAAAAPAPAPNGTPPAPPAAPPAPASAMHPMQPAAKSARAGRALSPQRARGRAHAGGLVVGDVLVRIDGVVHERPQHAARVQRRDAGQWHAPCTAAQPTKRAPVEREAEHRLRPVGHALRQRVQHPQRRAREAEANRVRRQAHEHREPRRQLRAEEAERLRHRRARPTRAAATLCAPPAGRRRGPTGR